MGSVEEGFYRGFTVVESVYHDKRGFVEIVTGVGEIGLAGVDGLLGAFAPADRFLEASSGEGHEVDGVVKVLAASLVEIAVHLGVRSSSSSLTDGLVSALYEHSWVLR